MSLYDPLDPLDEDDAADLRAEFGRPFRCSDRMCGGDDCARCYPSLWDLDENFPLDEDRDEDEDEENGAAEAHR